MRRIAVEEHFSNRDLKEFLRSKGKKELSESRIRRSETEELAVDLGPGRLAAMDKAGIAIQVLSLSSPGIDELETAEARVWARNVNNQLAEAISQHPARLAGLATLPLQDPEIAAAELSRSVKELGLKGGKINSHIKGEYLDDKKYWPVFEEAQKLGVPIYIHPREPSPLIAKAFYMESGMEPIIVAPSGDVGIHALRLIGAGVFDNFPRLKIIIGHMGETLPFCFWRLDVRWEKHPLPTRPKRKPSDYLRDNFLITTSGVFSIPPLICSYLELGAQNILFAVDYPYESNEEAVHFMDMAPIGRDDKEKIYHLNAERVFAL